MLMIMLTGTLSYTNVRTSSSLYSIMKENKIVPTLVLLCRSGHSNTSLKQPPV